MNNETLQEKLNQYIEEREHHQMYLGADYNDGAPFAMLFCEECDRAESVPVAENGALLLQEREIINRGNAMAIHAYSSEVNDFGIGIKVGIKLGNDEPSPPATCTTCKTK
jgi:hypothetical protein